MRPFKKIEIFDQSRTLATGKDMQTEFIRKFRKVVLSYAFHLGDRAVQPCELRKMNPPSRKTDPALGYPVAKVPSRRAKPRSRKSRFHYLSTEKNLIRKRNAQLLQFR